MTKRALAFIALILVLGGCSIGNPFKEKTVFSRPACEVDLTRPVELQRLTFRVPRFWAKTLPCHGGRVMWDTYRDDWSIGARLVYREGQVVVVSSAAGLLVGSDIHTLGRPIPTPEEWLAHKREQWAKSATAKGDLPRRDVTRVRHGQFDCWRIGGAAFLPVPGDPQRVQQSGAGLGYTCWVVGDERYPPFDVGMGLGYWDGKPLYDIDIDKDVLLPILDTLEVRELSEEAYAKRIADYQRRQEDYCRTHVKYAARIGTANIDAATRQHLRDCGYHPDTLKRVE